MYKERKELFKRLEEKRDSKVISYITSDRPGLSTQIAEDAVDLFVHHLDKIQNCKKLTLFLYTRGGNTLAGWRLVNLLRQFFDEIEVIISFKAHSTGTLISIGADNIIMTKQATLSPIDPSITTPLNPIINGVNGKKEIIPVSVEDIKGFWDLAKNEYSIQSEEYKIRVLEELARKVHPLVLGKAFRARTQIQMLAERLLTVHVDDPDKKHKIIDFLTSESGSHDYTIHRKEARDVLGLKVEKPSDDLYDIIIKIHNDYADELHITKAFDPIKGFIGPKDVPFTEKSGFIESIEGGSHSFSNTFTKIPRENSQFQIVAKGGWSLE